MRPIILLTCGGSNVGPADVPPPRPGGPVDFGPSGRAGVKLEYVRSVAAAGGVPVLLPDSEDPQTTARAMEVADGLLLTGGGDVEPARYGQEPHPKIARVDRLRDRTEFQAVEEAMRRGVPILGICRGIQVLNVVLGGTLIQDVPSHFGPGGQAQPGGGERAGLDHRQDHAVTVEGGSLLAGLWGAGEFRVNSRHHQAADRVAPPLRVTARASDGIIEALESRDGFPLLGLQCHPEDLSAGRAEFLAPFQWLVREARARRG